MPERPTDASARVSACVSARLKTALTGAVGTPLVLLGNIEVEEQWAQGEQGLPQIAVRGSRAVVNRMDELALLLAGPDDWVVLKSAPDRAYLDHLERLGLTLPHVLHVARQDPMRTVTQDALADESLITALSGLAEIGASVWPHGVSELEEQLARRAGLALAAPDAATCKRVNSKIYSRTLADDLGLRQPSGLVCRTVDEFSAACARLNSWLTEGRSVVLKDAYGVSGRGIQVVRTQQTLARIARMITRRAERSGREDLALTAETWVEKSADLNYQFTLGLDGSVHFDFVKDALTDNGVHKGHRMPSRLSARQVGLLKETAHAVGSRLADDGYFGVVGIDALVAEDGGIFPLIEINARNNMSTYQERLRPLLMGDDGMALATRYRVRLTRRVSFAELERTLDGLLLEPGGRSGAVVNTFATVNAAAPDGPSEGEPTAPFEGRLHAIVTGTTDEEITALDEQLQTRLAAVARIR